MGAVGSVLKTIAGPIITAGKSFIGGLFGRAKESARNITHRAIDNAKQAAVDAIQTGDIKGSAQAAWNKTKNDALATATAQLNMEREKAKALATKHLQQAQQQLVAKAKGRGLKVGGGLHKARFKRAERHAHKHIDKLFKEAQGHVRTAVRKRRTKKAFNAHKRAASKKLQARHKAGSLQLAKIASSMR